MIPFRRRSADLEFAVLRRADTGWWQFVAGGGEDAETPLQAALRETVEEVGISGPGPLIPLDSMATIPRDSFDAASLWGPSVYVVPEHCFAVDATDRTLVVSGEHTELRWASYEEARTLLRWDSNRNALWELNERLRASARRGEQ